MNCSERFTGRPRPTPGDGSNLNGIVVSGRSRMPAVKDVGEPCAGEPHARFEVAAGGNRCQSALPRGAGASRRPYGRTRPSLPIAGRGRQRLRVLLTVIGSGGSGSVAGVSSLRCGLSVLSTRDNGRAKRTKTPEHTKIRAQDVRTFAFRTTEHARGLAPR